jgi:hypothetical protein
VVDDSSIENVPAVLEELPYDVEYFRIERGGTRWLNPARPLNAGILRSKGRFTVMCHTGIVPSHDALSKLYDHMVAQDNHAHLARITENGVEVPGSQRPYFLFGGMDTKALRFLRGYDEDFTEYGYEDDDLAFRLNMMGVKFFHHPDITAVHMPHERHNLGAEMERMRQIHYMKMAQMSTGEIGVVRNLDRLWGEL